MYTYTHTFISSHNIHTTHTHTHTHNFQNEVQSYWLNYWLNGHLIEAKPLQFNANIIYNPLYSKAHTHTHWLLVCTYKKPLLLLNQSYGAGTDTSGACTCTYASLRSVVFGHRRLLLEGLAAVLQSSSVVHQQACGLHVCGQPSLLVLHCLRGGGG